MAACLMSLDHLTHLLFLAVQLYRRSALQALQEEKKKCDAHLKTKIRRQIYKLCDAGISLQHVHLEKPHHKDAFSGQVFMPHIPSNSF